MDPLLVVDALLVGVANVALVTLASRLLMRGSRNNNQTNWVPVLLAGALLRLGMPTVESAVVSDPWAAVENAYNQQKGCRMIFGCSS